MSWTKESLEIVPLDSVDVESPNSMVRIMLAHMILAYSEVQDKNQQKPLTKEGFLDEVSKNSRFRKIDLQMLEKVTIPL